MTTHGGHVVIGHGFRDRAEFLKGHFVELDDTFNGLIREMMVIKPSAEAQYNGTCLYDDPSSPENNGMGTLVHLPFFSRRMINGGSWPFVRLCPDGTDIVLEDGILAFKTEFLDLFQYPYC